MNATENVLTVACVEAHSEEIYGLKLFQYTEIEPEAAALISPLRKYLNLSGLPSISDAVAEALSNHYGVLDLSGLTEVSLEAAASLAEYASFLSLSSLVRSPEVAKALSRHKGYGLF